MRNQLENNPYDEHGCWMICDEQGLEQGPCLEMTIFTETKHLSLLTLRQERCL